MRRIMTRTTLDDRLDKIGGMISDAALYLETELNIAESRDEIRAIEQRSEALGLLLEHVQTAAWEKAKAIRVAETVSAIIEG